MREQQAAGRSFADENTTEEAARADYRKIAERRVRLGLLLAEVGTQGRGEDLRRGDDPGADRARALVPRPGKAGLGLLPQQQQALAELRAPIYEEKVVDHILGLAKVEDRKVTKDELLKPIDDELPGEPTIEARPPVA